MADSTITGKLVYRTAAGTTTGLPDQVLYAVPDLNTRRYDASGTYHPLSVNPNIDTVAYRFGVRAVTDAAGQFQFVLPYGATATKPTSPAAVWSIIYPDGRVLSGTVPSAAAVTIDDLETTYSWTWSSSVYVAPVTPGTLTRGSKTFTASASEAVVFSTAFASAAYNIKLSASVDSGTGTVPTVGWSSKSTTGFTIVATGIYTGTVDFEVVL